MYSPLMDLSDEQLIEQRRAAEDREHLIKSFDPHAAPRNAPALLAIRKAVESGPTLWTAALAAALRASDVHTKTIDNLIRRLVKHKFLVRSGEYTRIYDRANHCYRITDTRKLELGDWPTPGGAA